MNYPGSRTTNAGALGRLWNRLWTSPYPTFGCEISSGGISAARWSPASSTLEAVAWRPLAAGSVEASPLRDNFTHPEEVRRSCAAALSSLGITSGSGTDAVLILPDQAARLFVLDFEDLPARAAEAMPIVKLRLKKSVPFDIDSAALSYSAQRVGAGWQVVAVVTPQAIVQEYEQMAEELGLRPRWVNLSTLASLGLAEPMEPESAQPREGDGGLGSERDSQGLPAVLVVKYSPPWLTTAILQGRHLRLFRTAGIAAESEDGAAAQGPVLESIYPAVAYFQDTYAGRLERIYLCGLGETSAALADVLQTELPLQVAPLVEASRVAAGLDPDPAERHFAALLGIAREQQRAGN